MENYWAILRENLTDFWKPGQPITCVDVFRLAGNACELCGYEPITWNHVLENGTTRRRMTVGSNCVAKFRSVVAEVEKDFQIAYLASLARDAARIEQRSPGTTQVLPASSTDTTREVSPDGELLDYWEDAEAKLVEQELLSYSDDAARAHSDGWFYGDDDGGGK